MNRAPIIYGGVLLSVLAALVGLVVVPQAQLGPSADAASPSGDLARGRDTYIRLGCLSCHSQVVRAVDVTRGAAERHSVAGDYADEPVPLLGASRTGPDLANVGTRQPSRSWHYRHLLAPAQVSPGSIMPPYPFLFEPAARRAGGDEVITIDAAAHVPSERAADLAAYLLSLKLTDAAQSAADAPSDPLTLGRRAYAACRSCHQADGRGLEGLYPALVGSEWLLGDPESAGRLVLGGLHDPPGVGPVSYPEAMPAWDYWSDAHLAAVLTFARSAWGHAAPAVDAATLANLRQEMSVRRRPWTRAELAELRARHD